MQSAEFLPEREADHDMLIGVVDLLVRRADEEERISGVPGVFPVYITPTEALDVQVRARPGDGPAILDRLRLTDKPDAIVSILHQHAFHLAANPLLLQAETEEIWINNLDGHLSARKRVYSYEQMNHRFLRGMSEADARLAWETFGEHIETQRVRQLAIDKEEELLGLNRVSTADIERVLSYFGL